MTLKELRRAGKKYQNLVGLAHWDIEFSWMPAEEAKAHPDWDGCCSWSEQHTSARIFIHKKATSIISTLIHEILHIRIDGHLEQDVIIHASTEREICINALTKALSNL